MRAKKVIKPTIAKKSYNQWNGFKVPKVNVKIEKNIPLPEATIHPYDQIFSNMKVGDSFEIKARKGTDPRTVRSSFISRVSKFNKKYTKNYEFTTRCTKTSFRMWRTK